MVSLEEEGCALDTTVTSWNCWPDLPEEFKLTVM